MGFVSVTAMESDRRTGDCDFKPGDVVEAQEAHTGFSDGPWFPAKILDTGAISKWTRQKLYKVEKASKCPGFWTPYTDCEACGGYGRIPLIDKSCSKCNHTGSVQHHTRKPCPGASCESCSGTGQVPGMLWGTNPCPDCDGMGKCKNCEGEEMFRIVECYNIRRPLDDRRRLAAEYNNNTERLAGRFARHCASVGI